MSTVLWPVGPEPPGVYWRRRIVVLIVLVAVLVLLWWLLFGRSSGGDGAGPGPSPSPTVAPTESPTTPTESPSPSPTRTDYDCADADILVEAGSEMAIYPVGSTPQLTLTITNIGVLECRRDVGPGANELRIEFQGSVLWSSDDCNPSTESDIISLKRGEAFTTEVVWDGRSSAAGCPSDQPLVEAGEYSIVGRNGAVVSAPTGLRLE